MQDMLFGDKPSFNEIMDSLRELEKQINDWYKHQIVGDDRPSLNANILLQNDKPTIYEMEYRKAYKFVSKLVIQPKIIKL
jgi:hypothetical protein